MEPAAAPRVINLCRSYRYLSIGYYCSLLAEARGHKVVPSVRTIADLSSRGLYGLITDEINPRVQRVLGGRRREPTATTLELTIFFGHCEGRALQPLARQLFETFRCPILKVEFRLQGTWRIAAIAAVALHTLTPEQQPAFLAALDAYLSRRWRQPRSRSPYRYDLAILHDPDEDLPPSNPQALRRFQQAGRAVGVNVELIQARDYARLAEYDALFIRETTRIGHHTFRFARKAASEGLVVIDDPDSILRCTNKVFLAELLEANRVPRPRTLILRRETLLEAETIGYPVVLKIPEGSFSRGVFKAEERAGLKRIAAKLFRESDLILAQEYLYTPFDWRIGILGRRPLYAVKYFMSREHWQVVQHHADGHREEGSDEAVPLTAVPREVLRVALRAANLIGDGLYGVDVKAVDPRGCNARSGNARDAAGHDPNAKPGAENGVATPVAAGKAIDPRGAARTSGAVIIEVNDNPSLDAGIEDAVLGDGLYAAIIGDLVARLERRRAGRRR